MNPADELRKLASDLAKSSAETIDLAGYAFIKKDDNNYILDHPKYAGALGITVDPSKKEVEVQEFVDNEAFKVWLADLFETKGVDYWSLEDEQLWNDLMNDLFWDPILGPIVEASKAFWPDYTVSSGEW